MREGRRRKIISFFTTLQFTLKYQRWNADLKWRIYLLYNERRTKHFTQLNSLLLELSRWCNSRIIGFVMLFLMRLYIPLKVSLKRATRRLVYIHYKNKRIKCNATNHFAQLISLTSPSSFFIERRPHEEPRSFDYTHAITSPLKTEDNQFTYLYFFSLPFRLHLLHLICFLY